MRTALPRIAITACVLLAANVIAAEEAKPSKTNWSDTVDGLRLRIWTDKETYQTNEAIRLSMELDNVSSQELAVVTSTWSAFQNRDDKAPLYDVEKVIVSTVDCGMPKTWELYPVWSQMFHIQGMTNLPSNGTVREASRLNSVFWRMQQPESRRVPLHFPSGTYHIQVVYAFDKPPVLVKRKADEFAAKGIKCWAGKLLSNTVEIRVLDNLTLESVRAILNAQVGETWGIETNQMWKFVAPVVLPKGLELGSYCVFVSSGTNHTALDDATTYMDICQAPLFILGTNSQCAAITYTSRKHPVSQSIIRALGLIQPKEVSPNEKR